MVGGGSGKGENLGQFFCIDFGGYNYFVDAYSTLSAGMRDVRLQSDSPSLDLEQPSIVISKAFRFLPAHVWGRQ